MANIPEEQTSDVIATFYDALSKGEAELPGVTEGGYKTTPLEDALILEIGYPATMNIVRLDEASEKQKIPFGQVLEYVPDMNVFRLPQDNEERLRLIDKFSQWYRKWTCPICSAVHQWDLHATCKIWLIF